MDEFIFVLLAGLFMIGILLVAWGTPGEDGLNGTQVIVENPFSIGSFPKNMPRQISLGDFEVSYALGSQVIESKTNVEIEGKEEFSISAEIEQDISMVTGAFLTLYVRETNQAGNLIARINQKEVFNQKVSVGKIEIPIEKEDVSDYNIIEITTSGSGWKFWVKPFYKMDKIDFGANFYGNYEKTAEFQVYSEELRNFKSAEVSFSLNEYTGEGNLMIDVNNHRIFQGMPSLNFNQFFDQYEAGLSPGLNTISFSTESGSTYDISNAVLTIIREEEAKKSRSFEFTVDSSWNEDLEGSISFYISDSDYKGNLLVIVTDSSGNRHPAEAFQSYSIGETKTIDLNKDFLTLGKNTVTFEATDGNFVISNVEIKPKG